MPAQYSSEKAYSVFNLRHNFGARLIEFPNFEVQAGEHLLIYGQSGCGKTTLLHLLSGLISIQTGQIESFGNEFAGLSQSKLDAFRGKHIGLVFQQARFIKSLTVFENLAAAQHFGSGKVDVQRIDGILAALAIDQLRNEYTNGLSGGERQRLGIARAVVTNPRVILADEPTSSLDDQNTDRVAQLLLKEAASLRASLIVVSHDSRLRQHFTKRLEL